MKRLLFATILLVPSVAMAQQPQPTNSQAEVAAFLARNLSQFAGENDALQKQLADAKAQDEQHTTAAATAATAAKSQIADLQKQLADAKAKETPK